MKKFWFWLMGRRSFVGVYALFKRFYFRSETLNSREAEERIEAKSDMYKWILCRRLDHVLAVFVLIYVWVLLSIWGSVSDVSVNLLTFYLSIAGLFFPIYVWGFAIVDSLLTRCFLFLWNVCAALIGRGRDHG